MKGMTPKRPRVRLKGEAYRELRRQILVRDCWQCQVCGSRSNLEVQFRSRQGDDTEHNLITLCSACHRDAHDARSC